MAIPPLPPGSQPLAGSFAVDLLGNNLIQWASQVQEVASHMRWPPEAAVSCPQSDIIGVLDQLEGLTRVQYCQHCLESAKGVCALRSLARLLARWRLCGTPPTVSYAAMVSSTETTASTSAAGVTPPSHLPPGMPATRGHGHVAGSHYGELAGNCRRQPEPQATDTAVIACCP